MVRLSSSKVALQKAAFDAVDGIARDSALYEGSDSEAGSPTEETTLLSIRNSDKLNDSIQTFMAMCVPFNRDPLRYSHRSLDVRELHLQVKLIELQTLLKQTQHEPRLKGPFPIALYRGILTSLQVILDRLHSMRCVTTREEWCVIMQFML